MHGLPKGKHIQSICNRWFAFCYRIFDTPTENKEIDKPLNDSSSLSEQYFNNEEQLTAHRMVHHTPSNPAAKTTMTGERVYECSVCLKTFSKHSSWWKHKKCHTGERAYKCYICDKSFTQQANLHRVSVPFVQSTQIYKQLSIKHYSSLLYCSTCSFIRERSRTPVKFVTNASLKPLIWWNIRSFTQVSNPPLWIHSHLITYNYIHIGNSQISRWKAVPV